MSRGLAVLGLLLLAGCSTTPRPSTPAAAPSRVPTATPSRVQTAAPTGAPVPVVTVTATPRHLRRGQVGYSWSARSVTAADLPHSWHPGCPVAPAQLQLLSVRYLGFDGAPHTGEVVVNRTAVPAVVEVFQRLYAARFPIRSLRPIDDFGGSDDASMAADNTSGFNCRQAVGGSGWSMHAYGLAIDVDPRENPYLEGGKVRPPEGAPYVDRSPVRPGMVVAGGTAVQVFASVGWQWGGRWPSTPDYQHFSANGR